jgi:hypothetical protein
MTALRGSSLEPNWHFDKRCLMRFSTTSPVIEYADNRSQGKMKRPSADVATPGAGALILSQRAVDALSEFLGRFRQLLLVQTAGGAEFRHVYNVTNLVKRSEKDATGAITTEFFYDISVPCEPAVFKDPLTASTRLYVNDPGRDLLERLAAEAGLACGEPRDY